MGLTIHYKFAFNNGKQELEQILKELKQEFIHLPVRQVYDIVNVTKCQQESGYGQYEGDRFYQNELGFTLQHSFEPLSRKSAKLDNIIENVGGTINLHKLTHDEYRVYKTLDYEIECADKNLQSKILSSGNGYILPVDVGEGCEWFDIQIGRIGNSKEWRGYGFTKTQYAEDFVHCHLVVIKMLDLCKEAGILKSVSDEGNYWNTRDLKVLADEINNYTLLIKSFFGALKEVAEEAYRVKSKIEKCENYMVVDDKPGPNNPDQQH